MSFGTVVFLRIAEIQSVGRQQQQRTTTDTVTTLSLSFFTLLFS